MVRLLVPSCQADTIWWAGYGQTKASPEGRDETRHKEAKAPANPAGKGWSEFQNPQPYRFVADINTALGEKIFDVTEAHGETEVEPYSLPNNVGVKTVASVSNFLHRSIVSGGHSSNSALI